MLFCLIQFGFSATAEASKPRDCFSKEELVEIAESFSQIAELLGNRDSLCRQDIGEKWFLTVESLVDLRQMNLSDPVEYKTKDDLTFKAIPEGGWWSYFTKRADRFVLDPISCTTSMVAYVYSHILGEINLCPNFFEEDRLSRVDAFLHEVRHFDGFGHATCERGVHKGAEGACDSSLSLKGSYAVSMQASVTFGLRAKNYSEGERALARAAGLYYLANRFNAKTQVILSKSIFLGNSKGEIFNWDPEAPSQAQFVKALSGPSRFFSSGAQAIIYPKDLNKEAYRMAGDFSIPLDVLGLFAKSYNQESAQIRADYLAFSYQEGGGMLSNSGYKMMCGSELVELKSERFPEALRQIVEIEMEGEQVLSHLVGESGKLHRATCEGESILLKNDDLFVPRDLKRGVSIHDQTFGLTEDGLLYSLKKNGNVWTYGSLVEIDKLPNKWSEIALRSEALLFDEARARHREPL